MEKKRYFKQTYVYYLLAFLFFAVFVAFGICLRIFPFESDPLYNRFLQIGAGIVIFVTALLVVVETIALFINKEASVVSLAIALCLLGAFCFSSDTALLYFPSFRDDTYYILSLHLASESLFYLSLLLSWVLLQNNYNRRISVWDKAMLLLFFLLGFGLAFAETFSPSTVAFGGELILIAFLCIYDFLTLGLYIPYVKENRFTYKLIVINTLGIIAAMFGETMTYRYGVAQGITTFAMIAIDVIFVLVYLYFVGQTTKKRYENEAEVKSLQTNILLHQISPHYIFNALATVRDQYGKGKEDGNRSIELLSKTLRAYVSSGDSSLISFDAEMRNIMSYAEFENLKTEYPVEIVCNIEITEFMVPPLSLLTLVENAFRHSGVTEMKDGYVEIETYEDGEGIHLFVKDNGHGFDSEKGTGGSGIKNTINRFEILLHAKTEVHSSEKGTEIAIHIPISFRD